MSSPTDLVTFLSSQPNSAQLLEAALLDACSKGQVSLVKALLSGGVSANATDDKRRSALHLAASVFDESLSDNSAEIIHELFRKGAILRKSVILTVASVKALDVLLENGADMNQKGETGVSALQSAVCSGRHHVALHLLTRGALPESGLLLKTKNIEIIRALLKLGTDVNVKDNLGNTPLQLAVDDGNRNLARILLEAGASPQLLVRPISGIEALGTTSQEKTTLVSSAPSLPQSPQSSSSSAITHLLAALTSFERSLSIPGSISLAELSVAQGAVEDTLSVLKKISVKNSTCFLCQKLPRCILFLPCRHLALCGGCVTSLSLPRKCPVCQFQVDSCLSVLT